MKCFLKVSYRYSLLFFIFSVFIIFAFSTNVKAQAKYIWNEEKAMIANEYYLKIAEQKKIDISLILGIDKNDEVLVDLERLYKLAKQRDKVVEIERIITFYDKEYLRFEFELFTEDSKLAEEFFMDPNFIFSFERVLGGK